MHEGIFVMGAKYLKNPSVLVRSIGVEPQGLLAEQGLELLTGMEFAL
jgi:hypothetical protein